MAKGEGEILAEAAATGATVAAVAGPQAGLAAGLFRLGAGFLLATLGRWLATDEEQRSGVINPKLNLLNTPTHPTRWIFGYMPVNPWMLWHGNKYVISTGIPGVWDMPANFNNSNVAVLDMLLWLGQGKCNKLAGIFINDTYINLTKATGSDRLFANSQHFSNHLLAQEYFSNDEGPQNIQNRYNLPNLATPNHSFFHLQLHDYIEDNSFWSTQDQVRSFRAVVEGNECYDLSATNPETAPRVWTNNAASVWYTIERDCFGEDPDSLHLDSFREAYNTSEHVVENNFKLFNSAGAELPVGQFDKNFYEAYPARSRRYTASLIVNAGDNPRTLRERLSLAMCGSHVVSNGKLVVYAGANRRSVVHIRDEDIAQGNLPIKYPQQRAINKTHVIEATYISQANNMEERTITVKDQAAIDRDDGLEIVRKITLDTTDDIEARRKARQILQSQRLEETVNIVPMGKQPLYIPGEYIDLSSSSLKINKRPYRVLNKRLSEKLDTTEVYLKEAPIDEFNDSYELPELVPRRVTPVLETATPGVVGRDGQRGEPGWSLAFQFVNYQPAANADLNQMGDYKFSTDKDQSAAGIEDFEDLGDATYLHINMEDEDGDSINAAISTMRGKDFHIWFENDQWYRYTVTADPVKTGSLWAVPIAFLFGVNPQGDTSTGDPPPIIDPPPRPPVSGTDKVPDQFELGGQITTVRNQWGNSPEVTITGIDTEADVKFDFIGTNGFSFGRTDFAHFEVETYINDTREYRHVASPGSSQNTRTVTEIALAKISNNDKIRFRFRNQNFRNGFGRIVMEIGDYNQTTMSFTNSVKDELSVRFSPG